MTPDELDLDVDENRPAALWSVQEVDWRDGLPADMADLLAPPVIVSADPVRTAGRFTTVTAPARDNSRPGGYSSRSTSDDRQARFLTPAPPRPLRNRRAGHAA